MKAICPNCGTEFHFTPIQTKDTALGRARAEKGMSLAGVCKAVGGGLSIRQLSRLEEGLGTLPRMDIARKLATVYGSTLDELFPPAEDPVDQVEEPAVLDEFEQIPTLDPEEDEMPVVLEDD